jgi:hypothetical protein
VGISLMFVKISQFRGREIELNHPKPNPTPSSYKKKIENKKKKCQEKGDRDFEK